MTAVNLLAPVASPRAKTRRAAGSPAPRPAGATFPELARAYMAGAATARRDERPGPTLLERGQASAGLDRPRPASSTFHDRERELLAEQDLLLGTRNTCRKHGDEAEVRKIDKQLARVWLALLILNDERARAEVAR